MADVIVDDLDLDADLAELRALGPWLTRVLDAAGAASAHGSLELALHEVCVNVVTHAYDNGPGRIHVRSSCDSQTIEIEVRDYGSKVFDEGGTSEPVVGVPQIHGYGLMIARRLTDELLYHREDGMNVWLLRTQR
jgi:serine/threonine-protein kinase RsbW